jgi:hypothetical protein
MIGRVVLSVSLMTCSVSAFAADPNGDPYPREDVHGAKMFFQGIAGVQGSRRRHRLFDNLEIGHVNSLSNGRGRQSLASIDFVQCLHLSVD